MPKKELLIMAAGAAPTWIRRVRGYPWPDIQGWRVNGEGRFPYWNDWIDKNPVETDSASIDVTGVTNDWYVKALNSNHVGSTLIFSKSPGEYKILQNQFVSGRGGVGITKYAYKEYQGFILTPGSGAGGRIYCNIPLQLGANVYGGIFGYSAYDNGYNSWAQNVAGAWSGYEFRGP